MVETQSLLLGAFLGAVTVMALYHLALWAAVRERSLLYYALYLLAFAGSCFVWDGLADTLLWSDSSAWGRASLVIVDALAAMAAIQFTREFLTTRIHHPACDKVLVGLLALSALLVPLAVPVTWPVAIELGSLVSLVGPIALLVAGCLSMRRGYRPARYLVLAFAIHMAGISFDTALEWFSSPPGVLTEAVGIAYYGGTVAMVILFSLGVADRYNRQLEKRKQAEAEQEALKLMSYKDGLTGIWNRRRLDESLEQEWRRAAREHRPLAFILLDVDYFKKYNDHYGHQAGDACLRQVAAAVDQTATRAGDLVARYGGEEFAVLLPNAESERAGAMAEAIRRAVVGRKLPHENSQAASHVTVSVGFAVCIPTLDGPPQPLVEWADQALYEAKQSGRNCVRGHTEAEDQLLAEVRQLEVAR